MNKSEIYQIVVNFLDLIENGRDSVEANDENSPVLVKQKSMRSTWLK
jgi:hypothetical protein